MQNAISVSIWKKVSFSVKLTKAAQIINFTWEFLK